LFAGIGLFLFTLVLVAALLLSGAGNDNDDDPGVIAGQPTSTPTLEASPTSEANQVIAPTATTEVTAPTPPSITPTTAAVIDPTATEEVEAPTEEPVEEPTEEPTEPPTEDTEPAVGEFGELPPAEIPSGGLGRPTDLEYQLDLSLAIVPTEAPVYQLGWPDRTVEDVAVLAESLGIVGEVSEEGAGIYRVSGEGGSLYVTPGIVQYVGGATAEGTLEDDDVLLANARAWLLDNGLVQADIGDGFITSRDDASGVATAVFSTVDPAPILAAYPSARVTIGPGGAVMEAYVRWPSGYSVASYPLREANAVWSEVQAGYGYYEADLSGYSGEGVLSGTLTVTNISLAYSTAGNPAGNSYLVPVMVFSGEIRPADQDVLIPISIYVAAVQGESAPRG
jgi:hypothetical protein